MIGMHGLGMPWQLTKTEIVTGFFSTCRRRNRKRTFFTQDFRRKEASFEAIKSLSSYQAPRMPFKNISKLKILGFMLGC
jgi:hypothetical protein